MSHAETGFFPRVGGNRLFSACCWMLYVYISAS
jgi:hypothetical protein